MSVAKVQPLPHVMYTTCHVHYVSLSGQLPPQMLDAHIRERSLTRHAFSRAGWRVDVCNILFATHTSMVEDTQFGYTSKRKKFGPIQFGKMHPDQFSR